MKDTDQILRALQSTPRVRTFTGVYVGVVEGAPTVDLGGSRVPAAWWDDPVPAGTAVHVLLINEAAFILAPLEPIAKRPVRGTIATVGSGVVSVTLDTGETISNVEFDANYAPSSGHQVRLAWDEDKSPFVLGRRSSTVPPPAPPAPPPPPPAVERQQHETLFTAIGSASAARNSSDWFTNRVWASSSNIGVYVYGRKVADTLLNATSIDRVEIYLPLVSDFGDQPSLGWHPLERISGSTPSVTRRRSLDPVNGWVTITDLADALRGGGGIGFDGAGRTVYHGIPNGAPRGNVAGDEQAGALRIRYTT